MGKTHVRFILSLERNEEFLCSVFFRMKSFWNLHSLHVVIESSPFCCSLVTFRVRNPSYPLKTVDGADDGIEEIVAAGMILRCLQTRTGIKFVVTADPGTLDMDAILKEIYILYADCVLKDPFYELEMPIRSDLFSQAIDLLMDRVEKGTFRR